MHAAVVLALELAQIMGKVMKTAVRAKVIPHNPMAEVALPTITESEDIYLTPARWRPWPRPWER